MLNYQFPDTIFQCSKNYGSPTRVTRLKIAPNMADPIKIKNSDSSLKMEKCKIYTVCKESVFMQPHEQGDITVARLSTPG